MINRNIMVRSSVRDVSFAVSPTSVWKVRNSYPEQMEVDEARDIRIGISERGEQTIIHDECCMKHNLFERENNRRFSKLLELF